MSSSAAPSASASAPERAEPTVLASLRDATRRAPYVRKILVAQDVNYARELLVALARSLNGWIGWESASLRDIADELALVPLARAGRRTASDIELAALIAEAARCCIAAGQVGPNFARLDESLGFRRAVRDAVLELRAAGIGSSVVISRAPAGSGARDVGFVLAEYERLLADRSLADPASSFAAALEFFDEQAPFTLASEIWFVPMSITAGLPQQLADRLRSFGARDLEGDADFRSTALQLSAEHVNLFAGATPYEELREVFRRIVAAKVRFDQVEIATTDPDTYGVALDVLCGDLQVNATMLHGVPLARTRLGRAIERWFAWLSDGLPADVLRQALEAGELGAGVDGLNPPASALARELRRLRIGWGRARYEAVLQSLERTETDASTERYEDEDDHSYEARVAARRRSARDLRALLAALLDCTPPVPERGVDLSVTTTLAALASCTARWLRMVPKHGEAELQTADRLATRLEQLARSPEPETTFGNALAALRDALADFRAWPRRTSERKPWSSTGGMVHLTDLAHAGTTGREHVFVVGLDAERTSGVGGQDPLLPDSARIAIASDLLPSSIERRKNREWQAIAALNGLRGAVTLSHSTSSSLDGRESGPAALLLDAWRVSSGDSSLTYENLRDHVNPPASPVPPRERRDAAVSLIDARDVWLDTLNGGALLRDGTRVIRAGFADLDAGLRAQEAKSLGDANAYHGIVARTEGKLDPSTDPEREISPSSLERLAKCPLAWFYRYGVSLHPPEDPEYDPEQWLSPLQRGGLLHEVYEAFMRRYQGRQKDIHAPTALHELRAITDDAIARWRGIEPPPSEIVFVSEVEALHRAADVFLTMERQLMNLGDGGQWRELEMKFGDGAATATYELSPGRMISIKGRVDRIDELPNDVLRVVDYKTGSNYVYRKNPKSGPFNGGRQLQAPIYSTVSSSVLGKPVASFEYRFPTEKGRAEIVAYDQTEISAAREIVTSLLDQARSGAFVPTDDRADCTYCEYGPICRVKSGEWGAESPRAAWAKANAERLEVYQVMRGLRGNGGGADE